jgi:hypothetical protein
MEIFKENLRLRGIEIDEPKPAEEQGGNQVQVQSQGGAPAGQQHSEPATASVAADAPTD